MTANDDGHLQSAPFVLLIWIWVSIHHNSRFSKQNLYNFVIISVYNIPSQLYLYSCLFRSSFLFFFLCVCLSDNKLQMMIMCNVWLQLQILYILQRIVSGNLVISTTLFSILQVLWQVWFMPHVFSFHENINAPCYHLHLLPDEVLS